MGSWVHVGSCEILGSCGSYVFLSSSGFLSVPVRSLVPVSSCEFLWFLRVLGFLLVLVGSWVPVVPEVPSQRFRGSCSSVFRGFKWFLLFLEFLLVHGYSSNLLVPYIL